jgi:hypothetical protein
VKRLLKRYGDEIWGCCLEAEGYDPTTGKMGVDRLAQLPLAFQVYNQETFEEFLVRNALKKASQEIIERRRSGQ